LEGPARMAHATEELTVSRTGTLPPSSHCFSAT
jgi:hypothetical protein